MRSRYNVTPESNTYFITTSTRLWAPLLFNETIFDLILASLKYCQANKIHFNPVKKGFVTQPEHWKYSSARNYILGKVK